VRHTGRQMVEPLISALHERAGAIVESELEHASLGNLTPEQREEVLRLTHRVVNKLLHPPTAFLKEEFQNGGVDARLLNISARMFGLPAPEQPPISEQRSANKDIAPQFIVAEQPEDATINRGATPPRLNRASLPISETKDTT
ncbi:MAG: hypothetical protein HUU29_10510, partial [Planctomycetaceae bacterium]|nr:hypothetical protein [Planctomycetaceae bacterium]